MINNFLSRIRKKQKKNKWNDDGQKKALCFCFCDISMAFRRIFVGNGVETRAQIYSHTEK